MKKLVYRPGARLRTTLEAVKYGANMTPIRKVWPNLSVSELTHPNLTKPNPTKPSLTKHNLNK